LPRVVSRRRTVLQASEEIPKKDNLGETKSDRRQGNKLIDRLK
jgi:hypothetical protein